MNTASMTAQEFFDFTVRALHAQGQRSVDINDTCLYRGPNGLKCAVGHHIPDEIYDPRMEGSELRTLLSEWWHDQLPTLVDHQDLAIRLQNFHDSYDSWDIKRFSPMGVKRLREIASCYYLSVAVIDEICQ